MMKNWKKVLLALLLSGCLFLPARAAEKTMAGDPSLYMSDSAKALLMPSPASSHGKINEAGTSSLGVPNPEKAQEAAKKKSYTPAQKANYDALRKENGGVLAPKERFITTTAPAIVLTFGGLTRPESVEDMLDYLDEKGLKATFFVTELELRKYNSTISEIISRGHELGLGLRTSLDGDYYETCAQIERLRKKMKKQYGISPSIARQIFGKEMDTVNEACHAMGVHLLSQTLNGVQTKDKEAKSAEDIFPHLFGARTYSMGRGQIIYMRLDYLNEPLICSKLLDLIYKNKIDNIAYRSLSDTPETNPSNDSAYRLVTAGDLVYDETHAWSYPVDMSQVPYDLQPSTKPASVDDRNFEREFGKRYIGSPDVHDKDTMRGFPVNIAKHIDKTGTIHGAKERTVFFTFDDWGNDESVNHLLYVFRKHHALGNFFIITRNVKNNPNLLRAIALEGHLIGSHTNSHRPMVGQTYGGISSRPMTDEEYREDIEKAYEELAKTVGDVKVNGRYALTRLFRPPTLAISYSGTKSIMNAGYTYIVNGYDSTHDYAAPTLQAMVGAITHGLYDEKGNVRTGAVMVMHMSDNAKFTPLALDYLLTVNEQRSDDDPKKFIPARLDDYLVDGYSQSDETGNDSDFEKNLKYKGCCG